MSAKADENEGALIAGIDAGTSHVRTLIFSANGQAMAEGRAATPMVPAGAQGAEFDAEALWQAVVTSIRQAVSQIPNPNKIIGAAVASVGESVIPLDTKMRPLARALAWYDRRPQPQIKQLIQHHGRTQLHLRTGMSPGPIVGLAKMAWLRTKDPHAFGQVAHWLNVADFIAFRLCGEIATERSLAGRSMCFDLKNGEWATDLLEDLSISPRSMPQITDAGTRIGRVGADVAQSTWLPQGCAVGVGGHDHILGAFAAGAFTQRVLLDSIGTAEALLLPVPNMITDKKYADMAFEQGNLNVTGVSYHYLLGGLFTAGAAIEWFRSVFASEVAYDTIMQGASKIAPGAQGVTFLPHLRIGSPPHPWPMPEGAFVGLSADTDAAVLYRAVLEGLAFSARNIRDHMTTLLPAAEPVSKSGIIAIGGGTRNPLLLSIKADVYDRALTLLQSPEEVSRGAAMMAGLAAGVFKSPAEALKMQREAPHEVPPDVQRAALYEKKFTQSYRPALAAIQSLRNET